MNFLLVRADRNTHLKIAAVALACSLLAGLAFHAGSLEPTARKFTDGQFLADAAHPTVCRISEL